MFSLYYYDYQESTEYKNVPGGGARLDVSRFVRGENNCWQISKDALVKKPCNLIISDLFAKQWTHLKFWLVKERLYGLIDQGFSIYIWSNGELIPIIKSQEFNEQIISGTGNPEKDRRLLKAAASMGICKDSLLFLDYYKSNSLIQFPLLNEQIPLVEEFFLDSNTAKMDIEALKAQEPLLCFTHFDKNSFVKWELESESEGIEKDIRSIRICEQLSDTELKDVLYEDCFILEELELSCSPTENPNAYATLIGWILTYPGRISDLCSLEVKYKIVSEIDVSFLEILFMQAHKINILRLSGDLSHLEAILIGTATLANLRLLYLDDSYNDSKILKHILYTAKKLSSVSKVCTTDSITNILDELFLETQKTPVVFEALENIHIPDPSISAQQAANFLNCLPNLKNFSFSQEVYDRIEEQDKNLFEKVHFTQIESLSMSYDNSSFLVTKILEESLALKQITYLKDVPLAFLNKLLIQRPDVFFNVRTIDLDNDDEHIELSILLKVINNTRKLTNLSLKSVQSNREIHSQPPQSLIQAPLTSLKSIVMETWNFDLQFLTALLCKASQLKQLIFNVANCHNQDTEVNFQFFHLMKPALSSIHLLVLNQAFETVNVQKILGQCKNLRELHLSTRIDLDNVLNEEFLKANQVNFQDLETIDLSDSTANEKLVKQLADNLPELKTIKLNHCHFFSFENYITIYNGNPELIEYYCHDLEDNWLSSQVALTADNSIVIKKTLSCDADTTPYSDLSYTIPRVFFGHDDQHPEYAFLRESVFEELILNEDENCDQHSPFEVHQTNDPLLQPYPDAVILSSFQELHTIWENSNEKENIGCYLGSLTMEINQHWQAIPANTSDDKLGHLFVEGYKPDEIEINYSTRDSQYYIRSPHIEETYQARISFIIEAPRQAATVADIEDEELKAIIRRVRSFKAEALDLPDDPITGLDYINAINEQEKGACRHRAFLFMYLFQQNERFQQLFQVRLVVNKCHAFIEIKQNDTWLRCDLGGYPAEQQLVEYLTPDKLLKQEDKTNNLRTINPRFKTWDPKSHAFDNIHDYTKYMLEQYAGQNLLVNFNSSQSLESYLYKLHWHCERFEIPFFFINKPEQIVCLSSWIERQENNKGVIHQGPGGRFYDFLTAEYTVSPVIIINWSNFTAEEIARYNSIIDCDKRIADGIELPENTTVFGLSDTSSPNAYQGADFYGRFVNNEKNFPENLLSKLHCQISAVEKLDQKSAIDDEDIIIDLYQDPSWQQTLLGYWSLEQNQLVFIPGQLEKIIEKLSEDDSVRMILKNPPLASSSFKTFYTTQLDMGIIHVEGKRIYLPDGVDIFFCEDMNLQQLAETVMIQELNAQSSSSQSSQPELLNPANLGQFFQRYQLNEAGLSCQMGIIEEYRGKTLSVFLSRKISKTAWYKFLSECKKHQVQLQLSSAPSIQLPAGFISTTVSPALSEKVDLVCSDDIDFSLTSLGLGHYEEKIIDISELDGSNLLEQLDIKRENTGYHFSFHPSSVWQSLEKEELIVLKGNFKPELVDKLSELCLSGNYTSAYGPKLQVNGKIILITDSMEGFEFIGQGLTKQQTSIEQKISLLPVDNSIKERINTYLAKKNFDNYPFVKLQTIARQLSINPDKNPDLIWHAYHQLETNHLTVNELDENYARYFEQERLHLIRQCLEQQPFVFIAGVTGVGKSTFIKEVLAIENDINVYFDMKNIRQWAKDSSEQIKVLFIDEANIEPSNFSIFEGLYSQRPGILIDGEFYPLQSNHKLIFAGNPMSYGGERKLARFFERHGNVVTFHPLPPAFLYHKVIKPILGENLEAAQHLLAIYLKVLKMMPETVLLSPRELAMMAMLIVSTEEQIKPETVLYFAHSIARQSLPEHLQEDFDEWFIQRYKKIPQHPLIKTRPSALGNFILTPSRYEPYRMMFDLLRVREHQQSNQNSSHQCAGINALVFEGEPGDGKSQFVLSYLKAHGYVEVKPNNIQNAPENAFCHLPAGMPTKQKKDCLTKAFHSGLIVIEDEFNSCVALEKLHNSLLMGVDQQGRPAKKPGFKLIGTENPIDFAGRRAMSLALKRRSLHCSFSSYPREELLSILGHKFSVQENHVEELVDDFLFAKEQADRQQLHPKPSFRTLLTEAQSLSGRNKRTRSSEENESDSKKKKQQHQIPANNGIHFFNQPNEEDNQLMCLAAAAGMRMQGN